MFFNDYIYLATARYLLYFDFRLAVLTLYANPLNSAFAIPIALIWLERIATRRLNKTTITTGYYPLLNRLTSQRSIPLSFPHCFHHWKAIIASGCIRHLHQIRRSARPTNISQTTTTAAVFPKFYRPLQQPDLQTARMTALQPMWRPRLLG